MDSGTCMAVLPKLCYRQAVQAARRLAYSLLRPDNAVSASRDVGQDFAEVREVNLHSRGEINDSEEEIEITTLIRFH